MTYDVLINYCGLDLAKPLWSKVSGVHNFQRVLYLFKKEINSHEYFVYVRKILDDKQSKVLTTNFKFITNFSYTFAQYSKINDRRNKYLCDKFENSDIFHDRSLYL